MNKGESSCLLILALPACVIYACGDLLMWSWVRSANFDFGPGHVILAIISVANVGLMFWPVVFGEDAPSASNSRGKGILIVRILMVVLLFGHPIFWGVLEEIFCDNCYFG